MLDRVHKIAEIIATFAIVASLIFVGVQVKQNTIAMGAASRQSAMNAWNENALALATNEQLAKQWVQHRYPVFSEAQELDAGFAQVFMYISSSLNTIENQYLAYLDGNLDEEAWAGFKSGLIRVLIEFESYAVYWEFNSNAHSARFQLLVDELMLEAKERRQRYADSVEFTESE